MLDILTKGLVEQNETGDARGKTRLGAQGQTLEHEIVITFAERLYWFITVHCSNNTTTANYAALVSCSCSSEIPEDGIG
jgi:hypothetical protein